jgi:TonB family protein
MVAAGSSGQVLVDFVVEGDGTAGEVSTTETSDPEFAKAAVAAIQQWKFTPGQIGGQPVGTRLQIPVIFGISEDSGGTVPGFYVARTRPAPTSWF